MIRISFNYSIFIEEINILFSINICHQLYLTNLLILKAKKLRGLESRSRYNLFAEFASAKGTVSRGAVQAYGKSIHRRSFQLITRPVFISGSAPPPPGMCVTVNAHSPEHCGTLSLSMTDITHGRTSRWLL